MYLLWPWKMCHVSGKCVKNHLPNVPFFTRANVLLAQGLWNIILKFTHLYEEFFIIFSVTNMWEKKQKTLSEGIVYILCTATMLLVPLFTCQFFLNLFLYFILFFFDLSTILYERFQPVSTRILPLVIKSPPNTNKN